VEHKSQRVQVAGSSRVKRFGAKLAGSANQAGSRVTIPPGATVEFSWDVDPASSNAVWLVRLDPAGDAWVSEVNSGQRHLIGAFDVAAPGDPPDAPSGLLYTTQKGQVLQNRVSIPIDKAGTYRLYAGLVDTAENWCPDGNAMALDISLQAEDTAGALAFDDSAPPFGALVTLKVLVSRYSDQTVTLQVNPKTPDDERKVTLDANGDATLYLVAPLVRGPFTYSLLVDGKTAASATLTPGPTELHFDLDSITFDGGVPVGGFAHLILCKDGTYSFYGHFHDSGATEYNINFVWAIKDSGNHVYTFQQSGHVSGTLEPGPRDFDWRIDGQNTTIARNWADLTGGATQDAQGSATIDLLNLFNTVVGVVGLGAQIFSIVAPPQKQQ